MGFKKNNREESMELLRKAEAHRPPHYAHFIPKTILGDILERTKSHRKGLASATASRWGVTRHKGRKSPFLIPSVRPKFRHPWRETNARMIPESKAQDLLEINNFTNSRKNKGNFDPCSSQSQRGRGEYFSLT